MKSGAGYAEISLESGLCVGAYMAVNACGEVYDKETTLAGILSDDEKTILLRTTSCSKDLSVSLAAILPSAAS